MCAALVCAQEYRATLTGTVTDQSGAAVPGTRVTVANIETGVSANSTANDQGRYVAPYLLPGRYKLRIEQAGFKAFERGPFELRINVRSAAERAQSVPAREYRRGRAVLGKHADLLPAVRQRLDQRLLDQRRPAEHERDSARRGP
ncbi:MAG: carboxypeptidase-like regulatory domain-containing protein [Acidobacteria bacterium]|nr:carboxypeptidase-like regulatory domain-containing protein [Acidobacteriota bacterium]